jgi:hypothetical protein
MLSPPCRTARGASGNKRALTRPALTRRPCSAPQSATPVFGTRRPAPQHDILHERAPPAQHRANQDPRDTARNYSSSSLVISGSHASNNVALARAEGNQRQACVALSHLAWTYGQVGDQEKLHGFNQDALSAAREADENWALAIALNIIRSRRRRAPTRAVTSRCSLRHSTSSHRPRTSS